MKQQKILAGRHRVSCSKVGVLNAATMTWPLPDNPSIRPNAISSQIELMPPVLVRTPPTYRASEEYHSCLSH